MTATPGTTEREIFGNFLTIPVTLERKFDIQDLWHTTNYSSPDDTELYQSAGQIALDIHQRIPQETDDGSILIFVPGAAESGEVRDYIQARQKESASSRLKDIKIIELRSESSQEDYDAALEPPTPSYRKIIIATNVAETSVTIDGLMAVVDTMTERRQESTLSGNSRLVLHWISKSSSLQRRGRVGRTRNGIYYRMCSSLFYNTLEETRPDEIQRSSLFAIALSLLTVGLDPYDILRSADIARISYTLTTLKNLGGVDEALNPTAIGQFAAKLSIGYRLSRVLWFWNEMRSPKDPSLPIPIFPAMVVAALIEARSTGSFFYIPRGEAMREMSRQERRQYIENYKQTFFNRESTTTTRIEGGVDIRETKPGFKIIGSSDLETDLNLAVALFDEMSLQYKSSPLDISKTNFKLFCRDHSLNHKRFREFYDIMLRLYGELSSMSGRQAGNVQLPSINTQLVAFNTSDVMQYITPLIAEAYSDYRLTRLKNDYIARNGVSYSLDPANSVSMLPHTKPPEIIALVVREFVRDGRVVRLVSMAIAPTYFHTPAGALSTEEDYGDE
jgi:HrpA-like RNA helicase